MAPNERPEENHEKETIERDAKYVEAKVEEEGNRIQNSVSSINFDTIRNFSEADIASLVASVNNLRFAQGKSLVDIDTIMKQLEKLEVLKDEHKKKLQQQQEEQDMSETTGMEKPLRPYVPGPEIDYEDWDIDDEIMKAFGIEVNPEKFSTKPGVDMAAFIGGSIGEMVGGMVAERINARHASRAVLQAMDIVPQNVLQKQKEAHIADAKLGDFEPDSSPYVPPQGRGTGRGGV